MGHSDSGGNYNPPLVAKVATLAKVGELFGSIGWEKRLCDLSEDEVLAITVILKNLAEGLDDEYSGQHLTDLFFQYGGGRLGLTDADIPF